MKEEKQPDFKLLQQQGNTSITGLDAQATIVTATDKNTSFF